MSDFERQIQKGIVQASTALQDAEALAPSELYSKQFREARKVLSASMAGVSDLRAKLQAAERENKRYRKALLWIRSQLSCTLVPRNVWVKKLHGQIFMVCQTELEPE